MYKELWILNTCNLTTSMQILEELVSLGYELKVENGSVYYKFCKGGFIMYKELWILNTCNIITAMQILEELVSLGYELKVENGSVYYKTCS